MIEAINDLMVIIRALFKQIIMQQHNIIQCNK